jgi:hypothetical protein
MMAIKVVCLCGRAYEVPEEKAGRRFTCKACLQILDVPGAAADSPSGGPDTPPPPRRAAGFIRWQCDCGKRLKAAPENVGRRARCNGCGKPCVVPRLGSPPGSLFLEGPPPQPPAAAEEVWPLPVQPRVGPPPLPARPAPGWFRGRRRLLVLGAAGLLVLLLAAVGGWWLLSGRSPYEIREWYTADEVAGTGGMPGRRLTGAGLQLGLTHVVVVVRLPAAALDKDLAGILQNVDDFHADALVGGGLRDFHLLGPPGSEPPFPVRYSLKKLGRGEAFEFTGVWMARRADAEAGRLSFQYRDLRPAALTARTMRAKAP